MARAPFPTYPAPEAGPQRYRPRRRPRPGLDGLLTRLELAHHRVKDPADELSEGQEVMSLSQNPRVPRRCQAGCSSNFPLSRVSPLAIPRRKGPQGDVVHRSPSAKQIGPHRHSRWRGRSPEGQGPEPRALTPRSARLASSLPPHARCPAPCSHSPPARGVGNPWAGAAGGIPLTYDPWERMRSRGRQARIT